MSFGGNPAAGRQMSIALIRLVVEHGGCNCIF